MKEKQRTKEYKENKLIKRIKRSMNKIKIKIVMLIQSFFIRQKMLFQQITIEHLAKYGSSKATSIILNNKEF